MSPIGTQKTPLILRIQSAIACIADVEVLLSNPALHNTATFNNFGATHFRQSVQPQNAYSQKNLD
jgi:hypothetical protein